MPDIVAGLVGIGFLALWVYCIYDVITTDEAIIRHLPKVLWLLIVLLLPDIGSLVWLGIGRPRIWDKRAHDHRRYGTPGPRSAPVRHESLEAPETGAGLEGLNPLLRYREEQSRLRLWEAQLQRREEELGRRELGGDGG